MLDAYDMLTVSTVVMHTTDIMHGIRIAMTTA